MNLARAVESVTVQSGYSKTITLQKTLDIQGTDAKLSGIFLSEGTTTLRGSPEVATINMLGNSTFAWGAGNLENLFIFVNRADGNVAKANVLDPGSTYHAMLGTVFHIDGQLNWKSGNVDVRVPGAASGINISSTGEFNIGVTGQGWGGWTWGVASTAETKYFLIQNSGTVTVNAKGSTATLRGDYTTANLTQL